MKIPLNNTPELAQWYLERGRDQKANGTWWLALVGPIGLLGIMGGCAMMLYPLFYETQGAVGGLLAGMIIGLFGVFLIWAGWTTRQEGKHKIALGEAMNEAARRENYIRPRGVPTTPFMRGWDNGPNTRFYPVPHHPPVEPKWA